MKAAKENEAVTAEQWARESIRIARVTRELLNLGASGCRGGDAMVQLTEVVKHPWWEIDGEIMVKHG